MSGVPVLGKLVAAIESANHDHFWANMGPFVEYLESGQTLRFLVYPGPGMGHQSNTIHLLMQIIGLGFNGVAEVFYARPAKDLGSEARKLAALIAGFDADHPPKSLTLEGVEVRFRTYNEAWKLNDKTPLKPCDLGFSGGLDWRPDLSRQNYASFLNAAYLLAVQPYKWREARSAFFVRRDQGNDEIVDIDQVTELPHYPKRVFYQTPENMDEAHYALFSASRFKDKVKPYKRLLEAFNAGGVSLMPVYGVELFEAEYQQQHPEVTAPAISQMILFNLLAAILLQQEGNARAKAAVIPVMSNLTGTWQRLEQLMDGTLPDTQWPSPIRKFMIEHKVKDRVRVANWSDDSLEGDMKWAREKKAKRVLLLNLGGLPLYAFNFLYKVCDLPGVFEGQGTANLALNLGKAYFQLPSPHNQPHKTLYPTVPLAADAPSANAFTLLAAVRTVQSNIVVWNNRVPIEIGEAIRGANPAEALAQVLESVLNRPDSSLKQYFKGLGEYFHQEEQDKFLLGLFYLLNVIRPRITGMSPAFRKMAGDP